MVMKRILSVLACAVIAQVAFAQTSGTPALITPPPSQTADAPGKAAGTVTEFTDQTLTVKTDAPNPMSFALTKKVRFVDSKGKNIKKDRVTPGARVQVWFYGNEDTRTATRIIVEH
jgi:hypothetical protein